MDRIRRQVAKEEGVPCPGNSALIKAYRKMGLKSERVSSLIRLRPVRSLSGVVNISVLTKPFPCPGECIYCPEEEGSPKSYLSNEPAVMRAILNKYNPSGQVKTRLKTFYETNHPSDKIELRVVGATWSDYEKKYQEDFIKSCFETLNKKKSPTLEAAQKENEKSDHRLVCLSIETRPDFITKEEIIRLRKLGVTMVELGVQSIYDPILEKCKRGHKVKETIEATRLLKDAGFKVCYQIMPDLPGRTKESDLEMFRELFENPDFKPDFLKIYPCMVLENTPLYNLYKEGKYRPSTKEELISLLSKVKKEIIPYYVRIQRIIRDIPLQSVVAGGGSPNLREELQKRGKEEGWRCRCIRCREVKGDYDKEEELFLFREEYHASKGKEILLTFENKERTRLFSLLRLRIPFNPYPEVLRGSAIIRELHTYGQQSHIKNKIIKDSPQDKGLGKKLIEEAEKEADKIAVISGVGARDYWRKRGYTLKETYMIKKK